VRVEILDVNDNIPMFPDRIWTYRMSEAAEPGTEFVVPSAIDLDGNSRGNGIRSYTLTHEADDDLADKFVLKVIPHRQLRRSDNGQTTALEAEVGSHHVVKLVLGACLNRERTASHSVVLSAVDGGTPPETGSMTIIVEVIDANDNLPEFSQNTYEVCFLLNLFLKNALQAF
jgi:hypothetical protein